MDKHSEFYRRAQKSFHVNRPYGIRIDYDQKRFALFNRKFNTLGDENPANIEALPLENFNDVKDIPTNGISQSQSGKVLDVYFYTDETDPYMNKTLDMAHLKQYNQYMYPLSLLLDRTL